MDKMEIKKFPKSSQIWECSLCDGKWSKKSLYDRHLTTAKHTKHQNGNGWKDPEHPESTPSSYICKCNKSFNTNSGLWKHKQKCQQKTDETMNSSNFTLDKNTIMLILQQNMELQKQVIELCKEKTVIVNNNHNTTNNNQSFNMTIFLNEQCKDALNIGEFVNTLPLTLEDLENTGRDGYVKGITDIVIRGLKEMDIHKRPIHCSDLKREVIYIKDNDVWHKDEDNVKVKKAIQNIGTRNYRQVKEWIEKYPEAKDINTKKHDQYVGIRLKCTGGADNEEDDKLQNKILSNIAKIVHINKQNIY